jgi:hypothetical protein
MQEAHQFLAYKKKRFAEQDYDQLQVKYNQGEDAQDTKVRNRGGDESTYGRRFGGRPLSKPSH